MNGIIYYSNTGQSRKIAEYLSDKTSFPLYDIYDLPTREFDTAVLVFPVHCQNLPDPVKIFLKNIGIKIFGVIATYGRMCHGNVLYEIQKRYNRTVCAAAYVPTKHAYLNESDFTDLDALEPFVSKLNDPNPVSIPKSYKNPLSVMFKKLRSRMGVKIYKDGKCDNCGICDKICKNNAIINGKTNRRCIRCLKCVAECPNNALRFNNRLPMRMYLRKKKINELTIYV